ncbi:MAG: response regulator [Paenibacillaceae bacterium]|nr:response regulator [Paenibacillaceae bacterium]
MKKVLLVDDDTIVRITLRSLVDWGKYGYEIVADASNGDLALRYLREQYIDLLITDMKMPIMDGLQLLRELKRLDRMPCTVVLSSYDDFKMVRESFCLGACDYLLKSDINEEMLSELLAKLSHNYLAEEPEESLLQEQKTVLTDMAAGRTALKDSFFDMKYYVVHFEIDDFKQHVTRFRSNLTGELIEPFLEFARQIPRVAARCILEGITPSHYLMLYRVSDEQLSQDNAVSTCKQLINIWNNYMNLPVSAGISRLGQTADEFMDRFEEAGQQLELHYLKGRRTICFPWEKGQLTQDWIDSAAMHYEKLMHGIQTNDEIAVEEEKHKLLYRIQTMTLGDGQKECLTVIFLIARALRDVQQNAWDVIQEDVNYYEKLNRLLDSRSLKIWINNYIRWIMDYQSYTFDNSQMSMMIRAKRFIMDNYNNPELTLKSVAGYVDLNEKYFSTRFTKEVGSTFSNYLTEIRICKAKELMDKSDLKMYEISQQVGYNNVEHFTRVFKKVCKISPRSYKKSNL